MPLDTSFDFSDLQQANDGYAYSTLWYGLDNYIDTDNGRIYLFSEVNGFLDNDCRFNEYYPKGGTQIKCNYIRNATGQSYIYGTFGMLYSFTDEISLTNSTIINVYSNVTNGGSFDIGLIFYNNTNPGGDIYSIFKEPYGSGGKDGFEQFTGIGSDINNQHRFNYVSDNQYQFVSNNSFYNIQHFVIMFTVLNTASYNVWIDKIEITNLDDNINSLPVFNLTLTDENFYCIDTNNYANGVDINFTIDSYDLEDDTIYYSSFEKYYDNGLFFTEFNLEDCNDVDIYSIYNNYGTFFKYSFSEMGNGVYSYYYNETRRCSIYIDTENFNTSIFDKAIVFDINNPETYNPDFYLKLFLEDENSTMQFLFMNVVYDILNNITLQNTGNNLINISLTYPIGETIGVYNQSDFTQLKFTLDKNDNTINVYTCEQEECLTDTLITTLNYTISDDMLRHIEFNFIKNDVWFDDFILSKVLLNYSDFTTIKPTSVHYENLGTFPLRIFVSDNINLANEEYNSELVYISVIDCDYAVSPGIPGDIGDSADYLKTSLYNFCSGLDNIDFGGNKLNYSMCNVLKWGWFIFSLVISIIFIYIATFISPGLSMGIGFLAFGIFMILGNIFVIAFGVTVMVIIAIITTLGIVNTILGIMRT